MCFVSKPRQVIPVNIKEFTVCYSLHLIRQSDCKLDYIELNTHYLCTTFEFLEMHIHN
jgi:hypothetical protein